MRLAYLNFVPRTPVIPMEGEGTATAGVDFVQVPWPAPNVVTLERAVGSYLREHVVPRGGDVARTALACRSWFAALGPDKDAATLTRSDGRAVVQYDLQRGVKSATARRNVTMGTAALNHAKREERLVSVPKFQMPDASPPRLRWLTQEEVRRIMAVKKDPRTHRFLVIALETGARSKAIEDLDWSRVDFANRTIDFRMPGVVYRNKKRPIAPINDTLLVRLQAMYERRDPADPSVIGLGERGARSCTYHGCKEALREAGISQEGVCRHVFRHTFCSWRVQAGFSYEHIGALIGDTAAMVAEVYGHLSPSHLMAAANMDRSALLAARNH